MINKFFYSLFLSLALTSIAVAEIKSTYSYKAQIDGSVLVVQIENRGESPVMIRGAYGLPFYGLYLDRFFHTSDADELQRQNIRPQTEANFVLPPNSEVIFRLNLKSFSLRNGETADKSVGAKEKKLLVMIEQNGRGSSQEVKIEIKKN